ncbi:DUF7948 domain-containing protein [Paludibaculum fermentans]|uniref:SBBP repeat-containing protein n=1 Tax=Paludibaculum fermentans TaxID=1473598 RepID=A0A7S7SN74_PALFE|nr:RHS repeat-associated core domain-containing protein [Paludibaculum fermentans]QOY91164.1 SBBP repeat-containing protein [Paludibaculum fermentans]
MVQARRQTISWEQNLGQFPAEVRFVSRGGGARVALTDRGARLRLPGTEGRAATVSMDLLGVSGPIAAVPAEPQLGRSHYVSGQDPSRWITGARHFGRVRYARVYPGIDLEFHGAQRELEFDFLVAPLANPGRIEYRFGGASSVKLLPEGDLVIAAGGAEIRQRKPHIFQDVDGERREIAGAFDLRGEGRVGFHVGAYDRTRPLVIDPVVFSLVYDSFGSVSRGVSVDAAGNSIFAGEAGEGFPDPVNAGVYAGGRHDAFVLKLSPTGALIFATYLGGKGDDQGEALAVDAAGNIYLGGQTTSTDFPVTATASQKTLAGGIDAFVARLDPTGKVIYSSLYGGSGDDYPFTMTADTQQNVYIAGMTTSGNLKTLSAQGNAIQATYAAGGTDAFVAKFNTVTGALVYATYLGGDYIDEVYRLVAAPDGSLYAGGDTGSRTFPGPAGTTLQNFNSSYNAFVAKINPAGSALTYCSLFGGSDYDSVRDMALAADGTLYIAGGTASTDLPVSATALQKKYGGNWEDGFLAVLDPAGKVTAMTYLGGPGIDSAMNVGLNADGTLLVTASTSDPTGIGKSSAPGKPYAHRAADEPVYQYLQYTVDGRLTKVTNVDDFKLAPGTNLENCQRNAGSGYTCCAGYFIPSYGNSSTGPYQSALLCTADKAPQAPLTTTGGSDGSSPSAGDPVSTATGEMYSSTVDLNLGGIVPIRLIRYYASALSTSGASSALGVNWMHNYDVKLTVSGTDASILQLGGKVVKFTNSGGEWKATAPRIAYQLQATASGYRFLNPAEKLIYGFDSTGALIRVENRNGVGIDITPSPNGPLMVTDNLGRSLQFTYADGLLSQVTDSAGRTVRYSYDARRLSVYTDAMAQPTTYGYSAAGLLVSSTLPAGNVPVTQAYDDKGRVTNQTDALGNATAFAYDASGGVTITDAGQSATAMAHGPVGGATKVTGADGNTASAEYDSAGRRTKSVDLAGDSSSAAFDQSSGLPTSLTNAAGGATAYTYLTQTQDGFTYSLPSKVTFTDGSTISMSYDSHGNITGLTGTNGKTTQMSYDARGLLASATNATGGVTAYAYNDDGTLASWRSPAGNTNTFAYDGAKRRTKTTLPDGSSIQVVFDDLDRVVRRVNARGDATARTYTANGMVASVTDPLGATATIGYDANDRRTSTTNRAGATTLVEYDALGRATKSTGPTGLQVTQTYDAQGNVVAMGDASGILVRRAFDKAGRPQQLTDALGRAWKFGWDARRSLTSVTNPSGSSLKMAYDSRGRIVDWVEPAGQARHYVYDATGMLKSLSLSGGINLGFTRDDAGRLTGITDARGKTWSFQFDAAGRLASRMDPVGNSVKSTYDNRERPVHLESALGSADTTFDAADLPVRRKYSDGTDLQFTYDKNSRLTAANSMALAYDAEGRITASNGIAVTRDASGRIATITYAAGKTVQYAYDARGLLSTVTDWLGGITSFYYDEAMQLSAITRPNGVVTTYSYNGDAHLNGIVEAKGATLASTSLQLDAGGRVISADRNLPATPVLQDTAEVFAYDDASQVTSNTYDSLGRVTTDATRAYSWDLASRLKGWTAGDASATYSYDAFGAMITRQTPAVSQSFVINYALDMPSIATVKQGDSDGTYYIQWPDGRLLYSVSASNGSRSFFHFDESGNTTMLTGDDGTVTDSYAVTPYGEVTSQSGTTPNPFIFQGEFGVRREAGNLYYMRARFYDAATARFISRDPVLETRRPLSLNPYQYAELNPLTQIDPMGLSSRSNGVPAGAPENPQVRAFGFALGLSDFAFTPRLSLQDAKGSLRSIIMGADALVTYARIQYAVYSAIPFIGPPSSFVSAILSSVTGYNISPGAVDKLVAVDDISSVGSSLAIANLLGRDSSSILNGFADKTAGLLGQQYSDFFGHLADYVIDNDRASLGGAASSGLRNLLGGTAGSLLSSWANGLIGNDGTTLIGNDGATLIGNDGATLIGNDGATLIGNDGATLIGNDGATVVSNDGASLMGRQQ